jgi:hypothetical protein
MNLKKELKQTSPELEFIVPFPLVFSGGNP